ncbi:MAG TPA: ABC transporter permease [Thermomicrobiales bacterium]|nr:ABC transporter permease [Thermomicrobiales bacterium]
MSANAPPIRLGDAAVVREEIVRGQWSLFWRRFRRHRLAVVSSVFLAFIFIVAALAPVIAPYDPNKTDLQLARFGQPASPSLAHPMGSDQVGRDLLSRVIYGARVSLVVGFLATGVAITVGTVLGSIAGYFGRGVDMLIMRVADVLLAFPPLLFLMAALISVRPTIVSIALVIAVIGWMNVARLVRGEFLVLREREYTEAARAIGASPPSIIFRELLPNAMGPVIVAASLGIPATILTESTLSFLGFGLQPPTASWGNMLQNAFSLMRDYNAWWMGLFPGLMIALTVLSFNFLGDGLRDALDPRSRAE